MFSSSVKSLIKLTEGMKSYLSLIRSIVAQQVCGNNYNNFLHLNDVILEVKTTMIEENNRMK